MIDLVEKLRKRLEQPMPAEAAYRRFVPKLTAGQRMSFKYTEPPRMAAVLILLYEKNGEVYFPLIQRPQYEGIHSGQMALPGGRQELEDADLTITALRETHEEIGIAPEHIKIIGNLSEFLVSASNHLILPVIGYMTTKPHFIPDEIEVDEIIEAPLSQLLDVSRLKEKEIEAARGYRMTAPYFDIENKVVWGATAMMLSEFSMILEEL
jgi:8-oxo-dGTP pyrophosphatase MutT (NUDIX family)